MSIRKEQLRPKDMPSDIIYPKTSADQVEFGDSNVDTALTNLRNKVTDLESKHPVYYTNFAITGVLSGGENATINCNTISGEQITNSNYLSILSKTPIYMVTGFIERSYKIIGIPTLLEIYNNKIHCYYSLFDGSEHRLYREFTVASFNVYYSKEISSEI